MATTLLHPGLEVVLQNILQAAEEAGRDASSIRLIAVSKTHAAERIEPIIGAGQRFFGENRVQEAMGKWPDLRKRYPDVELHLIGPLQSNKVKDAIALFDVIHSVDRPKIAKALAQEMARSGRKPRLLVQVNTGEEAQKAGVLPGDAAGFVAHCQEEFGLEIEVLMCIPPIDEEPALHFALLAKIADGLGLKELSMGMSADYVTAIQFGATYVRIGTAIFGERGK